MSIAFALWMCFFASFFGAGAYFADHFICGNLSFFSFLLASISRILTYPTFLCECLRLKHTKSESRLSSESGAFSSPARYLRACIFPPLTASRKRFSSFCWRLPSSLFCAGIPFLSDGRTFWKRTKVCPCHW